MKGRKEGRMKVGMKGRKERGGGGGGGGRRRRPTTRKVLQIKSSSPTGPWWHAASTS